MCFTHRQETYTLAVGSLFSLAYYLLRINNIKVSIDLMFIITGKIYADFYGNKFQAR
jgi:hypothetical protein